MSKDYTICFTEDELKINPKVDTNGLQFICSKINNEQFESFQVVREYTEISQQ